MQFLPNEAWKKILVISLYALIFAAALYIFFAYLLRYTLPFLISFLIALFTRPVYLYLTKIKIKKELASLIVTALFFLLIGSGLFLLAKGVFLQLTDIFHLIMEDPSVLFQPFENLADTVKDKYPKMAKLILSSQIISSLIEKAGQIAITLGQKLASFAVNLPEAMLFLLVTVLSTYYSVNCFDDVVLFMKKRLPLALSCFLLSGKRHFIKYSKKYILCMATMLIITFFELLFGFYILKIPYALSLSFIIAIIDMLPILGVGTVLIPWALVCFASSDVLTAIGLVLMYLIITTVRQITEPRIMGKGMGLSPFITLITMYIGFSAAGVLGLLFAPLVIAVITAVIRDGLEDGK